MNTANSLRATPSTILLLSLACAMAGAMAGCGVKSVPGGTKGTLRSEEGPLCDIQINLHRCDDQEYPPVGFGVADEDGRFQLYTNGAQEPLWLPPGEYCCTLESAGSPARVPDEYRHPDSTPLKFSWQSDNGELELEVTEFE